MMMSMYSAVSGLKSQQTKLNVIGNNVANVNTMGYKSQSVGFSDLLSQTISAAGAAAGQTGGTNSKQIGLGSQVASITKNMGTGSSQYTGNDTDAALSGDGFFIVQGGGIGKYQFTRAGNFGVDLDGNLVVNGLKVCGWDSSQYDKTTGEFNTQTAVAPINMFTSTTGLNKKVIAPEQSTKASMSGNLSFDTTIQTAAPYTADATSTLTAYNALGKSYDVTLTYSRTGTDTWQVVSSGTGVTSTTSTLKFKADGTLDTAGSTINPVTIAASAPEPAFDITIDYSGVSMYTSSTGKSSVAVSSQDGYASGTLQDFSIGADGVITGSYSNGQKQPLGMVGLAAFTNSAGLDKIGENLYATTVNSGEFTGAVAAGTGGTGKLTTGALEMSNVDLANEFSEMMITQRAYQANSKIITTSDTLLETLINMSR
ncbi:flagellar hook protein FlgE [uncultured Anaeromusa sp.]|uniref:flagellar hook protein FlgE n=1 Tax=uncultured Anaeromusa sp. TaxID=673273 RepID=UPI0029C6E7FA|nr:flagellar hook protein FlgE [uncultured Anaeromusa sp.]